MNLKVKLLLIFSISAFTALSFFGYVAFDTASQESGKNETAALNEVFSKDLQIIADDLNQDIAFNEIISRNNLNELLMFALYDKQKGLVEEAAVTSVIPMQELEHLPIDNGTGTVQLGMNEAHWFTKHLPETGQTVVAFYLHSAETNQTFLSQMAVTLIFTAFIVLWTAAWSAMYIASLVEKLNIQKVELEKLATHDSLTGLPNRSLLNERVEQSILQSKRDKSTFALCFIDLNKFKDVNDTLGHLYGDRLLIEMSARLSKCVRGSDTVARLGGDEFAVVLKNVDKDGAEVAAIKLVNTIEQSIVLKNKKYFLSASIGIALFPQDGKGVQSIIKHADDVMYTAKKAGKQFMHYEEIADDIEKSEILSGFDDDEDLPDNIMKLRKTQS